MRTLRKGSTIGPYPYRIIRRIGVGRGGMAVIYLATLGDDVDDPDPMDLVVIKLSLVQKRAEHNDFFARAHSNEVEILRHLDHPGVVRLYRIWGADMGTRPIYTARAEVPGRPWFSVLEYLGGGSLDDLIKSHKALDLDLALYIAHAVAKTLAYIHQNGYVHLDLKPDNVLFRRPLDQGPVEPVLVDFGVARPVGRGGLEGGTLKWLPPERVRRMIDERGGHPPVLPHPSMDVYALGSVLYTMLVGRPPFTTRRRRALAKAILRRTPQPPADVRPDLPAEVNDVVMAMLAKAPDDRPTTEEVMATLRQLAPRRLPVPLPKAKSLRKVWAKDKSTQLLTGTRAKGGQHSTRGRRPKWASGLLATALALLAASSITAWAFQAGLVRVRTAAENTSMATLSQGEAALPGTNASPSPSPTPRPTARPTSTPVPVSADTAAGPPDTPTPRPTATPSPTPAGPPNTIDFENMGTWRRTGRSRGTFRQSANRAHQGTYSGQLVYAFSSSGDDFVVFLQERWLKGRPNAVRAWVYGDGRGHFLNVWIRDKAGQVWQVPLGRVTHTGWKEMVGRIDVNQDWPWTHVSGPNNGRVDYPIRFAGLMLDDFPDTFQGGGLIYIDDLRAVELSP